MTKISPISEVRAHLPEVVTEVQKKKKRFIITRQGRAACIMISLDELETLEVMSDPELLKSLIRAEGDIKAGRLYTHKEVFGA
jgi:prevent-host-death family protein